jgi:hypothetical protein
MTWAMSILVPAIFLGQGVVAIWLYVRFPRLRPATLLRAAVHVGISFGLVSLLPLVESLPVWQFPAALSVVAFVLGVLIPTVSYVLFSWLGLVARLHDLADSTPRGGHRVPQGAS